MAKPEITASDADSSGEAPPPASAQPIAKPVAAEVVSAPAPASKVKSEKALRLAQALRANLKRRKIAARPARPSN